MVSDSFREETKVKKKCPKCKGKGCAHCGGTGYHNNMNKGGMMNKGMKALKKAAPEVAKKMGYNYGGMSKKIKMNKGGYCGASNPAERPMKKMKK
jgi:type II secretory ATPase GspE/PulE/Tfp pilus assembly ATPase PilB-like protein